LIEIKTQMAALDAWVTDPLLENAAFDPK